MFKNFTGFNLVEQMHRLRHAKRFNPLKLKRKSLGLLFVAIVFLVLCVVGLIIHIKQSLKLARSFGKGTGFGICLILFGPIARLVLGFGSARYIGKR